MYQIPGYELINEIYSNADVAVFYGKKERESFPVIIKFFRNDYPDLADIESLRHEYEIISHLDVPGVPHVVECKPFKNNMALVFEDFGGTSIKTLIQSGYFFNIQRFLTTAVQLADILGSIHAHNVIHQDINPHNILINIHTEEVKIIDFSIAIQLERDAFEVIHPKKIQGTLMYISPEQTGRMNRPIDYRSDIYSLGVTLYEMVTGNVPFNVKDPMALIHAHIAKMPIPPRGVSSAVPMTISDIIMRCLNKSAEDRYQTATGLKADLARCLEAFLAMNTIEPFELGSQDVSSKFQIPKKLYGRDQELRQLVTQFEQVCVTGQSEMMLISGYPGVGKSALVMELEKLIVDRNANFIFGKYDLAYRDTPFSGLVYAFQGLIRQYLSKSSDELGALKDALMGALGANGQVMVEMIPELELIIGKQPLAPLLGSYETQNRLYILFKKFIQVIATAAHPLVLFLNQLQWADEVSLHFIESLMAGSDRIYLYMIGVYQANLGGESGYFGQFIDTAKQAQGYRFQIMALEPLGLDVIQQMVAETLHTNDDLVHDLSYFLLGKTNGNPFFLQQLLNLLFQKQYIFFDYKTNTWNWNIQAISDIEITTNVVALLLDKIQLLSEPVQVLLKTASCIGQTFRLDQLSYVSGVNEEQVWERIWEAVYEGLLVVRGNDYQFSHLKVKDACYELLSEPERRAIHLKIGWMLYEKITESELSTYLFDIVNHLNMGIDLIDQPDQMAIFLQLNVSAGQKAKSMSAYDQAVRYFSSAYELIMKSEDRNLLVNVCSEKAECLYLTGLFSEADALIDQLFEKPILVIDRIRLLHIRIGILLAMGEYAKAVEIGLYGLMSLGIRLKPNLGHWILWMQLVWFERRLSVFGIDRLQVLPKSDRGDMNAIQSLLADIGTSFYMAPNLNLSASAILQGMQQILQYGYSDDSGLILVGYAAMLCSVRQDFGTAEVIDDIAVRLYEQSADHLVQVQAKFYYLSASMVFHWRHSYPMVQDRLKLAFDSGVNFGDFIFAGYAFNDLVWLRILCGNELASVMSLFDDSGEFLSHIQGSDQWVCLHLAKQICFHLQGILSLNVVLDPDVFSSEQIDALNQGTVSSFLLSFYLMNKMVLGYLQQDYEAAFVAGQALEPVFEQMNFQMFRPICSFFYGMVVCELYSTASGDQRRRFRQIIRAQLRQLNRLTLHCAENWEHQYLLLRVAYFVVLSRPGYEISLLFDQAIERAHDRGFYLHAAIGNECAARYFISNGRSKLAIPYLLEAKYLYSKYGAVIKVRHLEQLYPNLIPQSTYSGHALILTTQTISADTVTETLDIGSVMKCCEAVAQEIKLDELLGKLLTISLENAGAQKGALIIKDKRTKQFFIQAQGDVDHRNIDILKSIPLNQDSPLCLPVVQYTIHTHQSIVVASATEDHRFKSDLYVITHIPKSIICVPIIYQGELLGCIYLENNLLTNAFNHSRQELMKVLASQSAITISHARLYQEVIDLNAQLEHQVQLQTQDLQQANQRLQNINFSLNQLNTDLAKAKEEALKAVKSKSIFFAQITHDLRTPLHVIIGALDMLLKKSLNEEIRKPLVMSLKSAEHQLTLVNDLLDLSKAEQGKMEVTLAPCSAGSLFDGISEMMETLIGGKSVGFGYENLLKKDLVIVTDQRRLNQILINLLSNSVKFTEKGHIKAKIYSQKDRLYIEVSDTGIGMTAEDSEKVFEAYSMVNNEIQAKVEGTGLGLTICREFVRVMGGDIQVQSVVNQGTTFQLWVPLTVVKKDSERKKVGYEADAFSWPIADREILICDDDEFNREFVRMILDGKIDYQFATNGEEALQKIAQRSFGMVFMDLHMPKLDGKAAVQAIRDTGSRVTVIALTAESGPGIEAELTALGFDDYLAKPFKDAQLLDIIRRYLAPVQVVSGKKSKR